MTPVRTPASGIPRLQEIEFLEVAATCVAEGATYEEIRKRLIDYMAAERERIAPTGNHAAFRLARHDPQRYMRNATEALGELMRLGMVVRAQLPTTRKVAPLYQNHRFQLTDDGSEWVGKLKEEQTAAYDELLVALWHLHPQFAGYLRVLATGMFSIPTANWGEVHRERAGLEGRDAYVRFLSARTANAVLRGALGWSATEAETSDAIRRYVDERIAAARRRQRPDPYPRSRDFTNACEEALVSFAFRRAGVQLDYISHEIIRRWTKRLAVGNFSYHVPAAPALRLWATATLTEDRGELVTVGRRTVPEWGDRVIDELPAAYELARARQPGNSWVPIYQVRATVCSKLGLGDRIFDLSVREFLDGQRRQGAPFRANLDPAEYGSTPPTEQPLRLRDRSGRLQVYRAMTIVPR
jgi:hypothetical protein